MIKDLFKPNPALILEFLIKSSKEKAVQKNKQRKIDYVTDVSTSVSSELFDNAIGLAHHRLDETEDVLSSLFETLKNIDDMEIEELLTLLDKIIYVINGWDMKDYEHSTIIQKIKESEFNY